MKNKAWETLLTAIKNLKDPNESQMILTALTNYIEAEWEEKEQEYENTKI